MINKYYYILNKCNLSNPHLSMSGLRGLPRGHWAGARQARLLRRAQPLLRARLRRGHGARERCARDADHPHSGHLLLPVGALCPRVPGAVGIIVQGFVKIAEYSRKFRWQLYQDKLIAIIERAGLTHIRTCTLELYLWRCPPFASGNRSRIITRTRSLHRKCIYVDHF